MSAIKQPGKPARGTTSGRPIMVLLDVLGQRWSLRILWEMRDARLKFRELQERCGGVSPTLLNQRLKQLRAFELIDADDSGYGLTASGKELGKELARLNQWAERWKETLEVQGS